METDPFPANLCQIVNKYSVITNDIIKSFDCTFAVSYNPLPLNCLYLWLYFQLGSFFITLVKELSYDQISYLEHSTS